MNETSGPFHIVSVRSDGPAADRPDLHGRSLIGLAPRGEAPHMLDVRAFARDPDHWRTWQAATSARDAMESVHQLLRAAMPVDLLLDGGERVTLTPEPRTPLRAFGLEIWFMLAIGLVSFLCAASVFAFRPERDANRAFALAGALVLLHIVIASVVESNRVGMSGVLLERLFSLMHLGEFALIASLAALAGVYPLRLRLWRTLRPAVYLLAALAAWLDLVRLGEGPALAYRIWGALGIAVIAVLLIAQWRAPNRERGARASGFVLALLALLVLDAAAYLAPPLLDPAPWIGRGMGASGLNVGYVLIGVLIYRTGLLDVDRWMFGAWLTFLAGLGMLLIDAAVAFALGQAESWKAALLMLGALAWIYFPLRQGLWVWLNRRRPLRELRDVSPLLFRRLLSLDAGETPDSTWRALIEELFAPLRIEAGDHAATEGQLQRGGLEMKLPASCGAPTLLLSHADRGNRLFTGHDLELARHLAALSNRVHRFRGALDGGARTERQRIAQDLHDDVIPPLLSLIYRADSRELAAEGREIMRALRDILRELDTDAASVPRTR